MPIEIKSSETISPDFFKALSFYSDLNDHATHSSIVYGGDRSYVSQNVQVINYMELGKTTLCKTVFPKKQYVSLENLDIRHHALSDPNGFLRGYPEGAIFDEIQRVPTLLPYIQTIVDQTNKEGFFILTGSQQFELLSNISQSLAGRTALLTLLPFSIDEIYTQKESQALSIEDIIYKGFYPRIFDKNLNPTEASRFYCSTYIERDVRSLINVTDLSRFEIFLKLCASRTGQILNVLNLGQECGISHNTAKSWLSVLEASYIITLVKPHYQNFNKRLIKAPKLYFLDTGLAAYLLDITMRHTYAPIP